MQALGLDLRERGDVVVGHGDVKSRPLELLAQVAGVHPDVVAVRGHAVRHAGQRGDAHRVERGARREVSVQVVVAAVGDAPCDRRQSAQRAHGLLAPPSQPLREVARAAQRVPRREPGQRGQVAAAPRLVPVDDGRSVCGLGIRAHGAPGGLDPQVVSQRGQRLRLVQDEGLGQLGKDVDEDGQAHRSGRRR